MCSSAQPSPRSRTTCASQIFSNRVRAMESLMRLRLRRKTLAQRVPFVRAEAAEGVGGARALWAAADVGNAGLLHRAQRVIDRHQYSAEQKPGQDRQFVAERLGFRQRDARRLSA